MKTPLIKWKVRKPNNSGIFNDYKGDIAVIRNVINDLVGAVNECAIVINNLQNRIEIMEKEGVE